MSNPKLWLNSSNGMRRYNDDGQSVWEEDSVEIP
jgi:hypothetical protein